MNSLTVVAAVLAFARASVSGGAQAPSASLPLRVIEQAGRPIAAPPKEGEVSDSTDLVALNAAWLDAYARHDNAAIARVLANGFAGVVVQRDGRTARLTKRDLVVGVADTSTTYEPVTYVVTHMVITGDVATLVGTNVFRGRRAGQPFETHSTSADVYARRDGKWRAVSMHVVRVAAP